MPLNILKRKKIPPRMIKHRIQHHRKALFVAQPAKLLKTLIIPQPALHMIIIHRIIPMRRWLKHRPNQQRITPQRPNLIQPPRQFLKKIPRRTRKVIPLRTIPHPQRIDMIKNLIWKNLRHRYLHHLTRYSVNKAMYNAVNRLIISRQFVLHTQQSYRNDIIVIQYRIELFFPAHIAELVCGFYKKFCKYRIKTLF